ncbi:MAG: hypothetical protein ACI8ZF_000359 [Candidatus Midichloriaceae bacterium]|jgi:hypothetical protein
MKIFVDKFNFLAILSLLVFSSCTSNRELFNKGEKGAAVFSVIDSSVKASSMIRIELRKLVESNNQEKIYHSFKLNGDKMNNYRIFFLEPGFYYIDKIITDPLTFLNSSQKYYPNPGIEYKKDSCLIKYGAFYIKGGEVKGLGRLDISATNSLEFKYYDEFDQVKYELEKSNYSYLLPKLKKGRFYEPGTVYFKGEFFNLKLIKYQLSMNKLCKEGVLKKEYCNLN